MSDTPFTPDLTFSLDELTTDYDQAHWFPFIEDQDCNITGPGHMDKTAFARLVDQYEEVTGECTKADDERWTADDISHRWIVPPLVAEGDPEVPFLVKGVTAETPGAVAVTTLWGAR